MPNTSVLTPGVYEPEAALITPPAPARVADRRRPGRVAEVNPALVPLLRQPASPETTSPEIVAPEIVAPDPAELWADRAPGRGLLIGVAISVVLWIAGLGALAAAFL